MFLFAFWFRVVVCAFGCVLVLKGRCVLFVMCRVLLHELFCVAFCVFVFVCARVRLMRVVRL